MKANFPSILSLESDFPTKSFSPQALSAGEETPFAVGKKAIGGYRPSGRWPLRSGETSTSILSTRFGVIGLRGGVSIGAFPPAQKRPRQKVACHLEWRQMPHFVPFFGGAFHRSLRSLWTSMVEDMEIYSLYLNG